MVGKRVGFLSLYQFRPLFFTMYSNLLRKANFLFHQTYHFTMLCEAHGAQLLSYYSPYVLQDLTIFYVLLARE